MKTYKFFTCIMIFVLASFLQSCKSDKAAPPPPVAPAQTNQPTAPAKRTAPQTAPQQMDAKTEAAAKKTIDDLNKKIEQTEKEVDKLLEGI